MNSKLYIYLDDVRIPKKSEWTLVRNYQEFVAVIKEHGLENIDTISLDHDLGPIAVSEYFNNVSPNYVLDYNNLIDEKTGYDCAKWIVDYYYDNQEIQMSRSDKKKAGIIFPKILTHSANPIGSANIMGYINNFLANEAQPQTCVRVQIPHTI